MHGKDKIIVRRRTLRRRDVDKYRQENSYITYLAILLNKYVFILL